MEDSVLEILLLMWTEATVDHDPGLIGGVVLVAVIVLAWYTARR